MKSLSFLLQTFAVLWLATSWSFAGFILNPYISGGAPPPPPPGDPYFANRILLLHGDGTDASTTVTDSSSYAHTLTASGNTQLDTAQKKWGAASILMDGSGDMLSLPHNTAFNFGTGDFTIEFWARWNSKGNYQRAYTHGSGGGSIIIQTGDGNGLFTVTIGGGTDTTELGAQPSTGVWYFYQFIRTSGTIKIYRDGVERKSGTNSGSVSQTASIYIGSNSIGGSVFNGWLDDFRVSNIAATPGVPTAAFDDS